MLDAVDLDVRLSKPEYKRVFPDLEDRLRRLQYALLEAEVPTVVVFEGWDAAGKGTVIQRLTRKLDPRAFRAWPGSPPSELEQRYHFLWRYQSRLPEDGHMVLFDHSWYGRVLVERVEKLVRRRAWEGAYAEINELERWLSDDGQVVVKFFFHISRKEQRRRLQKMEKDPAERWKVEKEDWRRNRRYDQWLGAIEDMLARTDTPRCPWTVVEASDARWTRVKVFRTLVEAMQRALDRRQQAPAAVSRTHLAEEATRDARARRTEADLERARTVAKDAGLPLEDPAFFVPPAEGG
ncbi:MAG TPA: polyphosphate kinase [Vicinamibacteria bacterium]|nr:polyphosphate kinase [Vicinamibacteria bacterium]